MARTFSRARNIALAAAAILVPAACLATSTAASAQDAPAHVDPSYPNPQPPYPDAAQVNGEQGDVVLDVRVTPFGKVRSAQVAGSSGFPDLDNAAVEGVLRWRFVPAMENGDTASSWTKVTISYRLPKAAAAAATGLPAPVGTH